MLVDFRSMTDEDLISVNSFVGPEVDAISSMPDPAFISLCIDMKILRDNFVLMDEILSRIGYVPGEYFSVQIIRRGKDHPELPSANRTFWSYYIEKPGDLEKFREEIPRYMIKHQVRPGLTGWAQINGLRGDTSIEKRIEHDLYYIENWTLGLDVKILVLTVFKGFINKNAY